LARHFDVIVVGIGAMGSAACFHLAGRGCRVLGIEQFDLANQLGSSHGETRLYRLAYYEHPDYVPLLQRAAQLWADLERDSGQTLVHRRGGVFMGRAECELIAGTLQAAAEHDIACTQLDRTQLERRFPQFHIPEDYVALHEPSAAILLPEQIIQTHAELARRRGAVLHDHEKVLDWQATPAGVTVRTDRQTYQAAGLVVCAGAWSSLLLQELGVPLTVTRQPVAWVRPATPQRCGIDALPVWAIEDPRGVGFYYGFPLMPKGLKLARHFTGATVDIQTVDRCPGSDDEADFNDLSDALQQFIPEAVGPMVDRSICVYTCSPDFHFLIDHHPAHDNVVIACGFSGHGFKFCPVLGEALADMALDGGSELPIGFLSARRFGATR
jgi:sarcosine oxidase